ncbi:MAG: helix-turn-helix transcriptional regulator [Halorhodospira sp.]
MNSVSHEHQQRLLRRPEVEQITGLARATIYEQIRSGDFPAPLKIGKRAVAWRLSDIEAWLNGRPSAQSVGRG